MEKYNGWEDPEWRSYWGVDDYDAWDPFATEYPAEPDEVIGWEE